MVIVRVSDLTAIFAILHDGITLIQDNVCATFYALLIRHENNSAFVPIQKVMLFMFQRALFTL